MLLAFAARLQLAVFKLLLDHAARLMLAVLKLLLDHKLDFLGPPVEVQLDYDGVSAWCPDQHVSRRTE